MSDAALEIIAAGPGNTLQDGGRHGQLRFGVTPAGPMDWIAHAIAATLAGCGRAAAAIEVTIGGIEVEGAGDAIGIGFACPGFAVARGGTALPECGRITLQRGERLSVRAGTRGMWGYLVPAAAVELPLVMGSLATHTRSGLGGLDGRMLRADDRVPLRGARRLAEAALDWHHADGDAPIRVVLGPQDDYFTPEALATFLSAPYAVSPQMDRMAYRLDGPRIAHAKGFNIVSDGIALGSIQIPGHGAPLVLMADRQPTGGYPKIATVIRADLPRLAQLRPGAALRFVATDVGAATALLRQAVRSIEAAAGDAYPLRRGEIDIAALQSLNIVDGVVDATAADQP